MKKHFFPSVLILLPFFSCSIDAQKKQATDSIRLRTSNKQLQSDFDNCVRLTRKIIMSEVGKNGFYEYFRFDNRATTLSYRNTNLHIGDTLTQMPNNYQIFYSFLYNGDTLGLFRADFDSTLKIIDYRKFHLKAFRQFIDNKLTVTRIRAIEIAIKNGMKRQGLDPILNCEANKFYWECKNDCDGCLYLEIDARNGDLIGRGKVIYQY